MKNSLPGDDMNIYAFLVNKINMYTVFLSDILQHAYSSKNHYNF